MAFRRPRLAWLVLVVFAGAAIFASAPQLHGHPVSLSEIVAAEGSSSDPAIGNPAHSGPLTPDECLACQIFGLALTLHAAFVLATPISQGPGSFDSPTLFAITLPLRTIRGRAPPTS